MLGLTETFRHALTALISASLAAFLAYQSALISIQPRIEANRETIAVLTGQVAELDRAVDRLSARLQVALDATTAAQARLARVEGLSEAALGVAAKRLEESPTTPK